MYSLWITRPRTDYTLVLQFRTLAQGTFSLALQFGTLAQKNALNANENHSHLEVKNLNENHSHLEVNISWGKDQEK